MGFFFAFFPSFYVLPAQLRVLQISFSTALTFADEFQLMCFLLLWQNLKTQKNSICKWEIVFAFFPSFYLLSAQLRVLQISFSTALAFANEFQLMCFLLYWQNLKNQKNSTYKWDFFLPFELPLVIFISNFGKTKLFQ